MRFFGTRADPAEASSPGLDTWLGGLRGFDEALDKTFESMRGKRGADVVFYAASAAGEFGLIWQLFSLLRLLRGGRRAALRASLGLIAQSLLVDGIVKSFFRRRRPQRDQPPALPLRQPITSSFPSGHASAAAFAAVVLSQDDPLAPLYAALAAVVASSRIYVRLHHTSDVLAGGLLGACLGLMVRRLFPLGQGMSRHRRGL